MMKTKVIRSLVLFLVLCLLIPAAVACATEDVDGVLTDATNETDAITDNGGTNADGLETDEDGFVILDMDDVSLNREIRIAGSTQAGALGSAIYASVAAGIYPDVKSAAEKMSQPDLKVYKPNQQNHKLYSKLYAEYKKLHDYFGRGENNVMLSL